MSVEFEARLVTIGAADTIDLQEDLEGYDTRLAVLVFVCTPEEARKAAALLQQALKLIGEAKS